MKVIHILKRIELIEEDISDLRKMEKSLARNKSFTTPIYMSIEKQINILLGEKIKLLDLKIENPPEAMLRELGEEEPVAPPVRKKAEKAPAKKIVGKKSKSKKEPVEIPFDDYDDSGDDIQLLTQDQIDMKIKNIEEKSRKKKPETDVKELPEPGTDDAEKDDNDDHIKLLDIALEKGTLNKSDIETEKKKVRFFKDNFPGKEY
ncbi:MAG TPA: hypothetical protein PK200_12625 [Spirochaetota bacterium]|nr:hypothetical protein [Spirochaetota bacterium]HQO01870.1 hypothetical protein [Spirochaetota bacterium]HQP47884.1 hypothetical protein [Spirochaetota bacterium]